MNRFQREMERAMQSVNQMQDEHRYITHTLRDTLAENRRLRFMQYGPIADRRNWHSKVKVDTYFDVINWRWVAFADIEVAL